MNDDASSEHPPGAGQPRVLVEDDRTGMHPDTLRRAVLDHLYYTCIKDMRSATMGDVYQSVAHAVRDRLVQRWIRTQRTYYDLDVKRVYYLSAEFLMGRALGNNLVSLGLYDLARSLLRGYDIELSDLLEQELDPGLGNGGLGRLAACFLDSMATLGLPGYGYGIRYEYGIFEQKIREGWQVEQADAWLRVANAWEVPRPEYTVPVAFGGRVEEKIDETGRLRVAWVDTNRVLGIPYDTPVAGFGNKTVNTLRLWRAQATKEFDLQVFNLGDFRRAVEGRAMSESISKVLYPPDDSAEGHELRLKQQYFFVACSVDDIVRRYLKTNHTFDAFADKVAIQLNDTHPAITVAELMRVFVDVHGLAWDRAWDMTTRVTAFTNHTLLPEALERWPVSMFERLLPRHLSIIYEINRRFLREVQIHSPGDDDRLRRMSIIAEDGERQVRMAHLAVIGSHSVNGVAELHSNLVRTQLLSDFAAMYPKRFGNVTNGVTPRRWLRLANPRLAAAITARIGDGWVRDLERLSDLADYREDTELAAELREIKRENKAALSEVVRRRQGIPLDLDAMFDVQIKRIHEYKRQLLAILRVIAHYQRLKRGELPDAVPRVCLFAGKAAPGYATAKLHIKLINDVAATINADPAMRGRLQVVFLANYGVSLAERIIPATDLSEQISMAGKEASGTGNMKFAMNGALTIGTLDGANIEIRQRVGADNFFLFGLDAAEAAALRAGDYRPTDYIDRSPQLHGALDLIASGFFSPDDHHRFEPVLHSLREHDPFLVCADFDAYAECQDRVDEVYRAPDRWAKLVVANLAHIGYFSSDRSIRQYAEQIWNAHPVQIDLARERERER